MITHDQLTKALAYDPNTGEFTRKACGSPCHRKDDKGYWTVYVGGRRYLASRLAWFFMTGVWPVATVDHADCDPSNDRWSNLRLATQTQQNANRRRFANNSSGFKGVVYDPDRKKWVAKITIQGRRVNLGRHVTPEAAHSAYVAKSQEAFGSFARAN